MGTVGPFSEVLWRNLITKNDIRLEKKKKKNGDHSVQPNKSNVSLIFYYSKVSFIFCGWLGFFGGGFWWVFFINRNSGKRC